MVIVLQRDLGESGILVAVLPQRQSGRRPAWTLPLAHCPFSGSSNSSDASRNEGIRIKK